MTTQRFTIDPSSPAAIAALPYATADVPGTGGSVRHTEEDFRVQEVLAYPPAGEGDHVFVEIEKRGLTTPAAAGEIARAVGVRVADVGWAGMKDKRAITRQTLSFPPPCTPDAFAALALPGISILGATRHRHKLRTGHLRGNRFVLRVRDLAMTADEAADRARAITDRLARPPGSPNWFGAQRFGRDHQNPAIGRALITGEPLPGGMRRPRGRQLRLYISALQSLLFNEYLAQRMTDGLLDRVIDGDLLQKCESGGVFASTETALDQTRLDAGEVVPTGPMIGHKIKLPPDGSAALRRERDLLDAHGLTTDAFARVGKLGTGARRPLAVRIQNVTVRPIDASAIEVSFELPAGSYATAVMREVVKGSTPFPG